ncbi:hypothetical protein ACFE04_027634 [Oxalis oulophora]
MSDYLEERRLEEQRIIHPRVEKLVKKPCEVPTFVVPKRVDESISTMIQEVEKDQDEEQERRLEEQRIIHPRVEKLVKKPCEVPTFVVPKRVDESISTMIQEVEKDQDEEQEEVGRAKDNTS